MALTVGQPVRNKKTRKVGVFVCECAKTFCVCVPHKAIKGAHDYAYWPKDQLSA